VTLPSWFGEDCDRAGAVSDTAAASIATAGNAKTPAA
jgi:hypothetical protein